MKLPSRIQAVFLLAFVGTLFFSRLCLDVVVPHFIPSLRDSAESEKGEAKGKVSIDQIVALEPGLLRKTSPKEAKATGQFWAGGADHKGVGIDLLGHAPLLNSLFPGYGQSLAEDKALWKGYFESEFGPDSFLGAKPRLSGMGLRVAYSWTGCFEIYEKYGADVLVIGSSEVYKSLIPEQLANELAPIFSSPPRVLFCATAGMPMQAERITAEELARLPGKKPQVIIWGYSFWQSFLRSAKLQSYQTEKSKEVSDYRERKMERGEGGWHLHRFLRIVHTKGASFFPSIGWDDMISLSLDKLRATITTGDQEGIEIGPDVWGQSDAQLSTYLNANLKPYYAITKGISPADCSLDGAEKELDLTVTSLKKISPNIFIYLAPTSMHHRRTVPPCYLPNVKAMLGQVTRDEKIHLLDISTEDFGLTDRDFISPLLDVGRYWFDINHTNYGGGEKVTKLVSGWVSKTWMESQQEGNR